MSLKTHLLQALSMFSKPIYGGIGHILMFHRVTPNPPRRVPGQARLEITSERLEEIIVFLRARNYEFLSIDQLPTRLKSTSRGSKFVVFTFDDGYLDNQTHAYPVLKQHSVPFTIYVATSFPEGSAVLWWYLLDDLILSNDSLTFDLPDGHLTLDCSSLEKKQSASGTLRRRIKYADPESYSQIIAAIFPPYGIDLHSKTRELALSWKQIRELDQDPLVTIGSHSMHHFPLKSLPEGMAFEEVEQSKKILEEKLGHPIQHFAYPYGERQEAGLRDFALVHQSSYQTAVTTRFASLFPQHSNHLECLPRFDAPALDDNRKLALAINGLLQIRRNRFRRVVFD